MDVEWMSWLQQDAFVAVFVNVLLQQIGLPVPAVPVLILAGSLAPSGAGLAADFVAATGASVLADAVWYAIGMRFGYRVLSGLCVLSINPASCVSDTEARFLRWGVGSLVVAKFIPGFSTVAPPIAGALRMDFRRFLLAAGVGAGLWAGVALLSGWLFQSAVLSALARFEHNGATAGWGLGLAALVWLLWKLWQRFRFNALRAVPHITPDELIEALDVDAPLLLDLRGPLMIAEVGPIPGAVAAEHGSLLQAVGDWPKDRPIVTLCACPQDAGAIKAARRLIGEGYRSVRPLRGGYDAWKLAASRTGGAEGARRAAE